MAEEQKDGKSDKQVFTIKTGLPSLVRIAPKRRRFLLQVKLLAQTVSLWDDRVALLHNMHFLVPENSATMNWYDSDVDRAFRLVSEGEVLLKEQELLRLVEEKATGSVQLDEKQVNALALIKTWKTHFVPVYGCKVQTPMKREGAALQACSYARENYLVALKNNVMTNFYPRLTKWLCLKLRQCHLIALDRPKCSRIAYQLAKCVIDPAIPLQECYDCCWGIANEVENKETESKESLLPESRTLVPETWNQWLNEWIFAPVNCILRPATVLVQKTQAEKAQEEKKKIERKEKKEKVEKEKKEKQDKKQKEDKEKQEKKQRAKPETKKAKEQREQKEEKKKEKKEKKERQEQAKQEIKMQKEQQKQQMLEKKTQEEQAKLEEKKIKKPEEKKQKKEKKPEKETLPVPRKITAKLLAKDWVRYLPFFHHILKDFESWHLTCAQKLESKEWDQAMHNDALKGYRLFSLCPLHTVGVKHISIDTCVLFNLTHASCHNPGVKRTTLQTIEEFSCPTNKWANWNRVFRLDEFCTEEGWGTRKLTPGYFIKTDGVAASIVLNRLSSSDVSPITLSSTGKKKQKTVANKRFQAADDELIPEFKRPQVPAGACIVGLDPGKNDVFFAVEHRTSWPDGLGPKDGKTSHLSARHYRQVAREPARKWKAQRWRKSLHAEAAESYGVDVEAFQELLKKNHRKTSSLSKFIESCQFLVKYETISWKHRRRKRYRRLKFDSYMAHQQADEFACKRLLGAFQEEEVKSADSSGAKSDKALPRHVVVAFGTARFNGVKGLPGVPTKRLYKKLKSQHAHECTVVDTDEYLTSQKCPRCHGQVGEVLTSCSTSPHPHARKQKANAFKNSRLVYGLKMCHTCSIVFNRDYLGASNIAVAWESLDRSGERPAYLARGQKKPPKLEPSRLVARPKKNQIRGGHPLQSCTPTT